MKTYRVREPRDATEEERKMFDYLVNFCLNRGPNHEQCTWRLGHEGNVHAHTGNNGRRINAMWIDGPAPARWEIVGEGEEG